MQLQYAFCARFAETGDKGTFSVIGGGINILRIPVLPATIPTLSVIVRLVFTIEECDRQHELTVELLGPDGQQLAGWPLVTPVCLQAAH